jgi:hypothetical protein
MLEGLGVSAVDASPAAVHGLVPSPRRNYERLVAAADTAQQIGLIHQMREPSDIRKAAWVWKNYL